MLDIERLKDYSTFEKYYFQSFSALYQDIENTTGYQITKLNSDIKFIIGRMELCLDKISKISNQFMKTHNEDLMCELTELTYLYVSYAYSILCINKDVLNIKHKIDNFDKKRENIFKDNSYRLIIHVLRNSFHHGQFIYTRWKYSIKKDIVKFYLTFDMEEIKNLTDKDGNKCLKEENIDELNNNDGRINILELFSKYLFQIKTFYEWNKNEHNMVYEDEIKLFNILMNNIERLFKKNNWDNNRFKKLKI